jgi:hypothetical protein
MITKYGIIAEIYSESAQWTTRAKLALIFCSIICRASKLLRR